MSAEAGALANPADLAGVLAQMPYTAQLMDAVRTNVAATDVTSGTTELDLARLAMPGILLETGWLYMADLHIINSRSVAGDEFDFRLRRDTAASGTLLGSAASWAESSTTGRLFDGRVFFTATGGSVDLFVSVVRTSGSGTLTVHYTSFSGAARTSVSLWRVAPSTSLREITV